MQPPSRRLIPTLLLAATLPGCCGIYAAWCGPDESRWVQVDFATPEAAVQTVLEAVRRSNEDVLYQAASPRLRQRLGITDRVIMRSVWARLEDEVTGLNALGDGDPGPAVPIGDDLVRFDVAVYGERVPLVFRRSPWRWRIQATIPLDDRLVAEREDATAPPPRLDYLDYTQYPAGEATGITPPAIATTIQLSPGQLERIEYVREWLLEDLPTPGDPANPQR